LKYALYLGCTIQSEQYALEASVREVFPKLGIELQDMSNTSCCGFPALSSISRNAWIYLSARNLAVAEEMKLPVLPLCNGCHLSFIETKNALAEDLNLKRNIDEKLARENLSYSGDVEIIHILEVLHDKIGPEKIKTLIKKPLNGLKIAAHPGCHAIRPSGIQLVDDSENPTKLDSLITAIGAETFDYPEKIDCCGSQLAVASGRSTLKIAGEKLKKVARYGFDGMTTTCPFCFKMYDGRQRAIIGTFKDPTLSLPIFYYTQLLGLSMGIDPNKLGLMMNQSPVDEIIKRIME
jgi:heterodisulfide reductase subunit B